MTLGSRQTLILVLGSLFLICLWEHLVWGAGDEETTRVLLAGGDKAFGQGRMYYTEALAKYTEALVRSPQSERGLYSRAQLLVQLNERRRALHDLDILLALAPDHAQGLALRMSVNIYEGMLDAAFHDAMKLVVVYGAQRKYDKQQETQSMANRLKQYKDNWKRLTTILNTPLLQHELGIGEEERKLYKECLDLLEHVIYDFARDSVKLRLLRASCALAVNDNQVATSELKYVLSRDSQNLEATALNAKTLRQLGALDQAKSELRRCLAINPEYASCAKLHRLLRAQEKREDRITRLMEGKNYEKVIFEIDTAFAVEAHPPNEERLFAWLCEANLRLQRTVEGHKACTAALERTGTDSIAGVDIHLHLAELFLLDDMLDEAAEHVDAAQKVHQRNRKVAELAQKIANLRRNAKRKNYYKILGVKKTASAKEIRSAYRKLAMEYHPDRHRSKNLSHAERSKIDVTFRNINEAKEVLLDEEKRARYDAGEDLSQPQGQGRGQPFYGHPFNFQARDFQRAFQGGFHQRGGDGSHQFFFFQEG